MKVYYWKLKLAYWRLQDRFEIWNMRRKVRKAFDNPPTAKHAPRVLGMAMAFAYGQSYESIAEDYNVTRERVRQCVAKFLRVEAGHDS